MKLATLEIATPAGPLRRLGAAVGEWVVDLAAAYSRISIESPGRRYRPARLSPVSNLRMVARVNGQTWTDASSAGRQFSFPDVIAHVSQSETIHPREVWGSGTVTGGSGLELGRWLKPGDVIELEIEGIGVLRNTVTG